MKYALISEQQLKIIKDALDQSEIWNHCGHTLETRAQAEEILESLKPSEPVAWITPDGEGFRMRLEPPVNDVPLGWKALYTALDKEQA